MTLEQKIKEYNKHLGFIENPKYFSFEISPEREIYKNEALINKDRELYHNYLLEKYPNELEEEMIDFISKFDKIEKLNIDQVRYLMVTSNSNLLVSDINFRDPNAIFHLKKVNEEDMSWFLEDNEEDLINAIVTIEQAFNGKKFIYLRK